MARKVKKVDPFYKSAAWFKVRGKVLARDGWCCVNCGAGVRAKGSMRVDHILPRRKYPEHALHMPNLRTFASPVTMLVTRMIGHGTARAAKQLRLDPTDSPWDRSGRSDLFPLMGSVSTDGVCFH